MAGLGLVLLCVLDICSNDRLGILDDQGLQWDAPTPVIPITTYEIHRNGSPCMIILAPATSVRVAGTECLEERGQALLTVKACNTVGCSAPSDPVEFLTYSCLRYPGCESPCFPEAPLYLSERYGPCP